ncbi:MAG: cytochrome P450 [Halorientalis sp.]
MAPDATKPPGPGATGTLEQMGNFVAEDMTEVLTNARERYGTVVGMRMPQGDPAVFVAEPRGVQRVLQGNQDNYTRSSVYRNELSEAFGEGLLTSEGDLWERQHRLIRPMFRSNTVKSFTDLILDETEAMLEGWETGDRIHLFEEMERVTLLVIGKAMFSADMEDHADEIADDLRVLRRAFKREVGPVPTLPDFVPSFHNSRLRRAVRSLNDIVYDLIDERRASDDDREDLLGMLLDARTNEGERMDDEQVRDELVTFLLAGHETTAAALTWTWFLLGRNPDEHRRLHEHVTDADDLRDAVGFSAGAAGSKSPLKRAIQESMRIYPPVPIITREADGNDVVAGYEVPAGHEVILSQYVVHRDPDIWDDPMEFRPERFAADAERTPFSYFPFGGGKRMCIGRLLALAEAQLILGRALEDHRLTLQSPTHGEPDKDSAVTMIPDDPVAMRVERWDG